MAKIEITIPKIVTANYSVGVTTYYENISYTFDVSSERAEKLVKELKEEIQNASSN